MQSWCAAGVGCPASADALCQSPTDDLAIADLKYRKLIIADEIQHNRRLVERFSKLIAQLGDGQGSAFTAQSPTAKQRFGLWFTRERECLLEDLRGRQTHLVGRRRWPSPIPRFNAFCRSEPSDRFIALTILLTGVLAFE
jgi:hypothetical protein